MYEQYETLSLTSMVQAFEIEPFFDRYNRTNAWTASIKEMWRDRNRCGGPITGMLGTETVKQIGTPNLTDMVK